MTKLSKTSFSTDEFASPGNAWRGKPFWSWNGKLEKNELIRQIHVLKEMGMGGYFMHSRTGLVTEYLGEEWFKLINACAEEGERLGMESWLYDEDRWPSGTAGGLVTANPDFRMKFIHMEKLDGSAFDLAAWKKSKERPLGAWYCRVENEIDIYDVKPVTPGTAAQDLAGRTVLAFDIIPMANGSFYNGNTYVDTMNRKATDEYIRLTHEAYRKHCSKHFGKSIKGIFTDEPHRGAFMSGFGMPAMEGVNLKDLAPWTEAAFDSFAEKYGTRIEENLPALFLRPEGQERTQIKAQYVDTLLTLFLENFARPYYDWCNQNNLLATGHVLHEDTLACQVSTNGSVQRYYPHMHVPGIDFLCEHGRHYWIAKQVDSTARQFNQPWILSELYGCTGWQMNFESHKAIGAWQALFGVNVRCHHLSWYTMGGEAKRDYPASILHQSPWYKEYNSVETWFARLGYFRAQGAPCCNLLVINPVESVWGRMYPGAINGMSAADPGIKALEKKYAELFHILCGNQIDFDYGDEALINEHGAVSGNGAKAALKLGAMQYGTVLIAGMETIRGTTLSILKNFVAAGGKVIVAGTPPGCVDHLPSTAVRELGAGMCTFDEKAILAALAAHNPCTVSIIDRATGDTARHVFCQLRATDDAHHLIVLNTNRDSACEVTIKLAGINSSAVEEWDLETGKAGRISLIGTAYTADLAFPTTLHTSQARCFRIVKVSALALGEKPAQAKHGRTICFDQPAPYTLADKNICVLDLATWSLRNGAEQPINDILRIDRMVRKQLSLPLRGGEMVQPWFRGRKDCPVLGPLTLRYRFTVDDPAALNGSELVMETPELFSLIINGRQISTSADSGWWVDVAFRRITIPAGIFVKGANEIILQCDFREDINLEAIYLLGDFAVSLEGATPRLGQLPGKLLPSSIVKQGFPFYSDSITYHYPAPSHLHGQLAEVELPSYEGAYCRISSGGNTVLIPWRPNRASLTLGDTLNVEICITRKNTFGPIHLTNPRPGGTGPHSFVPGDKEFSLQPVLIESGLLAPVKLSAHLKEKL
jgi:hypothetical protein